ncbi:MAG TPA: hypothetical protein VN704_02080 [Verrucomicrobiae bacterium]|nr:hypothetical protein [Verrucomicrobiae bacterium]
MKRTNVIAINNNIKPPNNAIFPNQSIFSLLIVPNSFNLVNAHIEANKPIGILIQKIDLYPK